jgi:hypothetical protein
MQEHGQSRAPFIAVIREERFLSVARMGEQALIQAEGPPMLRDPAETAVRRARIQKLLEQSRSKSDELRALAARTGQRAAQARADARAAALRARTLRVEFPGFSGDPFDAACERLRTAPG